MSVESKMARLASTAAQFCHRIQELYPQKLTITIKSEQSSPFRRWTTGSGAGSSYRHTDHRTLFAKQMSEGAEGSSIRGSQQGQWPNGGVARWSLGLEQLLADPAGYAAFAAFLDKEFSHENIQFWRECERYASTEDPHERAKLAKEIWNRHLGDNAPEPVNVDSGSRRATLSRMSEQPPPNDLFNAVQRQIFNVMKFDSYPRFLRSAVHAECARADLRGQPSPYKPSTEQARVEAVAGPSRILPAIPGTSSAGPSDDIEHQNTPTKLKKSTSNAERRRNGGPSSLLLKLRVQSRDRAAQPSGSGADAAPAHAASDAAVAAPAVANAAPVALTDVVKSGALCRVVLPDGATSVVEVDPALPIRRLVDKLLQRRNLLVVNYDVLLKEAQQDEPSVMDANAPSTVLGGREVVVERRSVVRMEVGGRVVAVRCRGARRLRHVIRPVLARYTATPQAPRAVLHGNTPVHPDTPMQELDGARLEIVDLTEDGEYRERANRDDDADSFSDVAVRIYDDDQSVVSGRSGRSEPGACACAGRVRAALRPGPPLHHHPPDFLENLRETQKQRLQNKNEPVPAPRTPPPLPPKPSSRPPTLV